MTKQVLYLPERKLCQEMEHGERGGSSSEIGGGLAWKEEDEGESTGGKVGVLG